MGKKLALPTKEQVEWHDMEVGMFIHWAPNVYQEEQHDQLTTPMDTIDPEGFDAEAWVKCAIDLGAKYIILVAKHVGGFCLWQTDTTPYSVKNIKWKDGKGDIVKEVSDACRRHGLKLGVYLSPMDRYLGVKVGGVCETSEAQEKYDAIYRQQLTELLTHYGEMAEVWFDGSTDCEIGGILKEYAPNSIVFQSSHANIRWVGNEDGFARYPAWNGIWSRDAIRGTATIAHSDPEGDAWMPLECDTTIRSGWFWSKRNCGTTKTLEQLTRIYYETVGNGAVLLLNSNPDPRAVIPPEDAARARELGDAIRQLYSSKVASTAGEGAVLELSLEKRQPIDHIVIMEDIRYGERVRSYKVEGWDGNRWRPLANGTAIGHKRIHPIREASVEKLRLTAVHYAALPVIKDFSVYLAKLSIAPDDRVKPEIEALHVLQWGRDLFYANGRLENRELLLHLTHLLTDETDAGVYEIHLQGENGQPVITGASIEMDDVAVPAYLETVTPDTLRMTLPGVGMKIVLRIMTDMPSVDSRGVVLLRKL